MEKNTGKVREFFQPGEVGILKVLKEKKHRLTMRKEMTGSFSTIVFFCFFMLVDTV